MDRLMMRRMMKAVIPTSRDSSTNAAVTRSCLADSNSNRSTLQQAKPIASQQCCKQPSLSLHSTAKEPPLLKIEAVNCCEIHTGRHSLGGFHLVSQMCTVFGHPPSLQSRHAINAFEGCVCTNKDWPLESRVYRAGMAQGKGRTHLRWGQNYCSR